MTIWTRICVRVEEEERLASLSHPRVDEATVELSPPPPPAALLDDGANHEVGYRDQSWNVQGWRKVRTGRQSCSETLKQARKPRLLSRFLSHQGDDNSRIKERRTSLWYGPLPLLMFARLSSVLHVCIDATLIQYISTLLLYFSSNTLSPHDPVSDRISLPLNLARIRSFSMPVIHLRSIHRGGINMLGCQT
ncbi:hypothetical protein IE53DRAFT_74643 [Violaceomyces palustris]|uniref:Uncharacterized protein n=1 Tax=Violaceomyces palustris TaxID=1673888 RepID=A0ACD0NYN7_9BASI|nr:hypothetical protein IE53DRAFT_74643 [Violaceomyces palustris]